MVYELDGALMTDRETAHSYLKSTLALPEYYGRNLDALYDLLTEQGSPIRIVLKNTAVLSANLNAYADMLISTFQEAAAENPMLEFEII